jgi:dihydropteroate synthase
MLNKHAKKNFDFGKKTYIMGILNVTPDSFSDGGEFFSVKKAVAQALKMEKDGADIIDIGGESTRPGSATISILEEEKRVMPVLEKLIDKINIPLSIDTYKSDIAQKALGLGASMVNDITALQGDEKLVEVVSKYNVPICLMHMKGKPRDMQINPQYIDVVKEISDFLKARSDYAVSHGIQKRNIIIDPGLGFGKRTGHGIEDNIEILKRLPELKKLGFPILVGPSRKAFIGNIFTGKKPLPPNERLQGSIASAVIAAINGADIIRVHDVKETRKALEIVDCMIR